MREILSRTFPLAHRTLPSRLRPVLLRQSQAHTPAIRTIDLDIHHLADLPRASRSLTPWLRLFERTELVLTLETERLLGTRGAHRSAIIANNLCECTASDGILAGRIVTVRPRHLAANGLLRNLWHSRLRLWFLLLLLPTWIGPPTHPSSRNIGLCR